MSALGSGAGRMAALCAFLAQSAAGAPLAIATDDAARAAAEDTGAVRRVARTAAASVLHLRIALDHAHSVDIASPPAIALAGFAPEDHHGSDADPFIERLTLAAAEPPRLTENGSRENAEPSSARKAIPAIRAQAQPEERSSLYRLALTAVVGSALIGLIALGCGTTFREMRRRRHRRAPG